MSQIFEQVSMACRLASSIGGWFVESKADKNGWSKHYITFKKLGFNLHFYMGYMYIVSI